MRQQQGATLFSTLAILAVLTVVGTSAARLSVVDIKVASNEQQKVATSQQTSNELINITRPEVLYEWLERKKKDPDDKGIDDIHTEKLLVKRDITAADVDYTCIGNGGAVSIGIDAPSCSIFDFNAGINRKGTGFKDNHYRGAAKEKPTKTNIY